MRRPILQITSLNANITSASQRHASDQGVIIGICPWEGWRAYGVVRGYLPTPVPRVHLIIALPTFAETAALQAVLTVPRAMDCNLRLLRVQESNHGQPHANPFTRRRDKAVDQKCHPLTPKRQSCPGCLGLRDGQAAWREAWSVLFQPTAS